MKPYEIPPPLSAEEATAKRLEDNEQKLADFSSWCNEFGIPLSNETILQMVNIEPVRLHRGGLIPTKKGEEP